MRNLRLPLFFACLVLPALVFAGGGAFPDGLRPPLGDVLERSGPDELIPVSIVLREQAGGEQLRLVGAGLDRAARRQAVIGRLKAIAAGTQGPLVQALRGDSRVQNIRPLWIGNLVGVEATPELIRRIAARPEVAWVNHNPKVDVALLRPDNLAPDMERPEGGTPAEIECGTDLMGAPRVWNELGITGRGAVIAVVDSGVCYTHPDIINQIWVNPGEDLDGDGAVFDLDDANGVDDDANGYVDDFIGWDFDQNDNDPDDENSHGSHVAGTVAGDGTSGTEAGVAPDAAIMVVRVGLQFSDEVSVWAGMQYAAENGADSISMSLGWPHNQNPDRATWRQNSENTIEAGTAMVVAAGNEGQGSEPDNIRTPSDVPRIITVAATDCSDNIASFSSRGPVTWQDVPQYGDWPYPPGLVKPDVAGPGVSTRSHAFCSGYSSKSGTSMATPHVAGAVALMMEANPGLAHDEIKQVLMDTSIDLGAVGKDNHYGQGRVDAFAAVDAVFGLSFAGVELVEAGPDYGNGDGGIDTGEIVTVAVNLESQWDDTTAVNVRGSLSTSTPGVTLVHDYATWPDVPPLGSVQTAAPHFSVRIDEGCNYPIDFILDLAYNDRVSSARFSLRVGTAFPVVLLVDDFESDQGWTTGGTATTGHFVRDDPNEVEDDFNGFSQPEDDVTPDPGVAAWVTGNANGPNGSDDVDDGNAWVQSPVVDGTNLDSLNLAYSRYYYAFPGTIPPSNFMRAQWSIDGVAWANLEELSGSDAEWTAVNVPLPPSAYAPGLQIRFWVEEASAGLNDAVIELLVDEVNLAGTRIQCDLFTPPVVNRPNGVGDTLFVDHDGVNVRLDWTVPVADGAHDPATLYRIHRSTDPSTGFTADGMSIEPWHVETGEASLPGIVYFLVTAENGGGPE
ncbi:MAG: S8 family serine peptidase [Acidobacteria bacterium]|uniref:S8 family serine peptidase n=1 Tax=Candidatus Polarisedimenticola svalbardensis TaxID=2886004 RepID=A0A8J6Y0L0_9BACT|nr:S8 family serine peptidase [Candidatus Polarisedimenticola svalbardensis]